MNKEKLSKMKKLSRFISIIAKIGFVLSIIGCAAEIIAAIFFPIYLTQEKVSSVEVNEDKVIVNTDDKEIVLEENGDSIITTRTRRDRDRTRREKVEKETVQENVYTMSDNFERNHGMAFYKVDDDEENNVKISNMLDKKNIPFLEASLFALLALTVVYGLVLRSVSILFNNFYSGETPFTDGNVKLIRKIAKLVLAGIVIKIIARGVVFGLLDVSLDVSVVELLIILSMAYIFEYGYELQKQADETL